MPDDFVSRIAPLLEQAQALEEQGQFAPALAVYDEALGRTRSLLAEARTPEVPHNLAVLLLRRGHTLQALAHAAARENREADAVASVRLGIAAFDEAAALFASLPADDAQRHHLGLAYLNRGNALQTLSDYPAAAAAFEQAIAPLEGLPSDADPGQRHTLAGAWSNLAQARLATLENDPSAPPDLLERGRDAARSALAVLAPVELQHAGFAELSLRTRRLLVVALYHLIARTRGGPGYADLAAETSDAFDDALQLARAAEQRGAAGFRPLSLALLQLGADFYAQHKPRFLAEFLLENVDPSLPDAVFAAIPEFVASARDTLERTLAHVQRPGLFLADSPEGRKRLDVAQSLRAALARLPAPPPPAPPEHPTGLPPTATSA